MTCWNCLHAITEGEHYRKASYRTRNGVTSRVIYIHYPHCPEGADPCAHYQQNVLAGKTEYRLIEEAKYIKEPVL